MKRKFLLFSGMVVIIPAISFLWNINGIPKTWNMEDIKKFHLPPPDSTIHVTYPSEEYYNALPDHVITKTFPMYVREFEKSGYLDSLRNLTPEIAFDVNALKTPDDWIKAGQLVFNWPVAYSPVGGNVAQLKQTDFANGNGRITSEGIYPFSQYVLAERGKLVVGSLSCASCHTRVTESGEAIPGAQGNIFNTLRFANAARTQRIPFPVLQAGARNLSYAPWAPEIKVAPDTPEEFASYIESIPAGAVDRQGGGYLYPFAVPSLIGIKDIKYLDRTGLMKHESPGDMMRYAAFNQGMDMLTSYNGFIPGGKNKNSELPLPSEWNHPFGYSAKKYTDAQLYALTQYIYSLKPPKNPHQFSTSLIEKGRKAFTKAGCVTCHTPPLYTNNKLTPVNGFEPPKDHFKKYDIFNVSVETDSVSALYTRRGTGYYKVPSLRGVWFQSAFFHNGTLTTLEEVVDPKRLSPEFVPTGFMPPHLKSMAVKGHPFGMELNEEEKKGADCFYENVMNMFDLILILFLFGKEGLRRDAIAAYSVKFSVVNAGFEVEGNLKVKNAHIEFDPDHFLEGQIHVIADASSIETGIGIRDKHLKRSDYLDTTNHPEIRLQSKSFGKRGKNEFVGKFDLTIKSITKEVTIPFTLKKKDNTTYYQGNFDINRLDFNIGEESLTLDGMVHVQVSAVVAF